MSNLKVIFSSLKVCNEMGYITNDFCHVIWKSIPSLFDILLSRNDS